MRTCPNCNEENINEAYFCHSCGYKLRDKTNGWKTAAIVFLILLIVSVCFVFYFNSEIDYLTNDCRYYQDKINSLKNEVNQKSATINELEAQVARAQATIDRLRIQVQEKDAEIDRLRIQVQEKDAEISRLNNSYGDYYYYQNQVNSLNKQIENMQSRLPQTYYTIYDVYYNNTVKVNGFKKRSFNKTCKKGTSVIIYKISAGSGLTDYGWIPMYYLEKR